MKKILLIALLYLGMASSLWAQNNVVFSYPISFGVSDLGKFIGQPSFRGISFDYRYTFKPNIALGVHFAWQTFYESKDKATYTLNNESLTGKQYRYSNQAPMLATVTYWLKPEEPVNPFVTLGVGAMYTRRNTDMNLYTREEEGWPFVLQPEIGVQFEIATYTAVQLSAKYYHGFEAGDFSGPQSYFAINLGFAFY